MEKVTWLPLVVVLVAALVAAVGDLRSFRISNWLTLPLLGSGLLYHATTGGLLDSVLGALLGFVILLVLCLMGGVGAGDVKLLAGIGAWLGLPLTVAVILASSVAAGIYALVLVFVYQGVRETMVNFAVLGRRVGSLGRLLGSQNELESELRRPDRRRHMIPFAAMIAVGFIGLLIWVWMSRL